MKWLDFLYERRFTVFMVSLAAIMFGNLLMPEAVFTNVFAPISLIVNILSGILLAYKKRGTRTFYILILSILIIAFLTENLVIDYSAEAVHLRFFLFFIFYAMVTKEIVSQVWRANEVNETVILGLASGYICLGLLGYFVFMSIEIIEPGSFSGLTHGVGDSEFLQQDLLYFSYITLLTIGYGEILPVSNLAKDAAILIGLLGQFYMVIITAIVVGKFLSQKPEKSEG